MIWSRSTWTPTRKWSLVDLNHSFIDVYERILSKSWRLIEAKNFQNGTSSAPVKKHHRLRYAFNQRWNIRAILDQSELFKLLIDLEHYQEVDLCGSCWIWAWLMTERRCFFTGPDGPFWKLFASINLQLLDNILSCTSMNEWFKSTRDHFHVGVHVDLEQITEIACWLIVEIRWWIVVRGSSSSRNDIWNRWVNFLTSAMVWSRWKRVRNKVKDIRFSLFMNSLTKSSHSAT